MADPPRFLSTQMRQGGPMSVDRLIDQYDPAADLAERHPNWYVRTTKLHGLGEVIDCKQHLILIDPQRYGRQYAIAHALAHLDLGHVTPTGGGAFLRQQEADAHWLAAMRLDAAAEDVDEDSRWDDIPVDGEPTVRM